MSEVFRPDVHPVSRRRFLQGSALAGLTLGAHANLFEAGAGQPWRMRLSCSSIAFMSLPLEEACRRIAGLGFEAIDIWSAHAKCPHLDDAQKRLGPQGLKDLLARSNLKLYAFSVYAGGYPKYAELLGGVGGGVAVRGSAGPVAPKDSLTDRMKAFQEGLKPMLELAEKHNAYLAIENHGHALLDSLDSVKAFVDLNRHPRLGIALAPYHLQAQKVPVEDAILASGKQLFFFYAWQHAPGVGQLPGHGPADCRPWIEALRKIDYRWYVNPFMHHEPPPDEMAPALAKARDYLQSLAARITSVSGAQADALVRDTDSIRKSPA